MALTPELKALRTKLERTPAYLQTTDQRQLLDELVALDSVVAQKSIEESTFSSQTRMTSPGGDACPCCGR
jgi:hypothetical protein